MSVQRPLNDCKGATHPASTMSSQSFWQNNQRRQHGSVRPAAKGTWSAEWHLPVRLAV